MPEGAPRKIRIYCICGQKMKIDPSMYGRAGKCVACKQKIRIPRADEITADTREIYLSEHPEFLRSPPPLPEAPKAPASQDTLAFARKVALEEEQSPEEAASETPSSGQPKAQGEAIALGAGEGDVPHARHTFVENNLPLEVFRPLQEILSFQYWIDRDLHRGAKDKQPLSKSALMAYGALLRRIRADIDQDCRRLMGEVNARLEVVEQEISETLQMLRRGELGHPEYQDRIVPLRRQREYFLYCIRNLQGWLEVTQPSEMGGLLSLEYADIPCAAPQVTLPEPPNASQSLVELVLDRFREALARHSEAEKCYEASANLETSAEDLDQVQVEVDYQRALAAVLFYRERLDQLAKDCENDIQALKSAIDKAETAGQNSLLDMSVRRQRQKGWQLALNDNRRLRDLLQRALAATTASETPRPPKTLVAQMAFAKGSRVQLDSWIAWLCSLILMMGILLPITRENVNDAAITRSITLGFFFSASALAAVALLPMRLTRGLLLCLVWVTASLAWGYYLIYLRTGFEPTMQGMGRDPYWYLAPGVLLLICAFVMATCSALVSLHPFQRFRAIPYVLLLVLLVTGYAFAADGFGLFRPRPALLPDQVQINAASMSMGKQQVAVPIENRGRWPMYVVSEADDLAGYVVELETVERYESAASSAPMRSTPTAFRQADKRSWTALSSSATFNIRIDGGETALLRYALLPGRYNLTLRPALDPERIAQSLILEIGEASPTPESAPETQQVARENGDGSNAPSGDNGQPSSQQGASSGDTTMPDERSESVETEVGETPQNEASNGRDEVILELRGVVDGADTDPSFALSVQYPSGSIVNDRFHLSQEIYPPWIAHEYNPTRNTLTIYNGEQLVVMERGRQIRLSESGNYIETE